MARDDITPRCPRCSRRFKGTNYCHSCGYRWKEVSPAVERVLMISAVLFSMLLLVSGLGDLGNDPNFSGAAIVGGVGLLALVAMAAREQQAGTPDEWSKKPLQQFLHGNSSALLSASIPEIPRFPGLAHTYPLFDPMQIPPQHYPFYAVILPDQSEWHVVSTGVVQSDGSLSSQILYKDRINNALYLIPAGRWAVINSVQENGSHGAEQADSRQSSI